jgi:ATP-dependent DNA helicase UvrD/PcrA
MMSYTDEQLKAINSKFDNNLILAGPGTGKSYTILGLIEKLIGSKGIDPKHILILTFTRTATSELKKKITKLLGASSELPKIFTLHGFSLRQLLRNSSQISMLPQNFVIADDYEERNIILEDLKSLLNIDKIKEVQKLFNLMASNWETLNADTEDWEQNFSNPEFIGAWQEHREIYGYVLRSELVYQFKNILEIEDNIKIDGPIEYLIVDEYQDLNKCDLRVIKNLNVKGAKLFCAGDDDQSIYGFRYAYPEGIKNFNTDISNSNQYQITKCRRCDSNILSLAMDVIRQDYRRIPKSLKSITNLEGETNLLRFQNQDEEATKIAKIISDIIKNKVASENEIIILLRSDFNKAFSSIIKSSLEKQNINVNSNKGFYNLFESKIGRFFVSITKLFEDQNNDLALRNILLLTKGIGHVTTNDIYNNAKSTRRRFHNIISDIVEGKISSISKYKLVKKKISEIYNLIDVLKESTETLEDNITKILNLSDIDTSEFHSNLLILINSFELNDLSELSYAITDLFGPAEPLDENTDGVRIMSMHQAKGLTADVVFIVAAEDEYIPGRGDIDEERRLFYVSLTRARHKLFISYCRNRTGQQQHSGFLNKRTTTRNLTRYLKDLPSIKTVNGNSFTL